MAVVIDSTFMLLLVNPRAGIPIDRRTHQPIDFAKERVEHLIKTLEQNRTRIILPAPAYSEIMVRANRARKQWVERLEKTSVIRIEPFDARAALELALMTGDALERGDKRDGATGTWAKIKFDRQIVSIARVHRAERIYTDDENVEAFAEKYDIEAVNLIACDIPQEAKQGSLRLDNPNVTQAANTYVR